MRFLKEGQDLDNQSLPDWMETLEMGHAMSTLRKFSEKERDYPNTKPGITSFVSKGRSRESWRLSVKVGWLLWLKLPV